MKNNIGEKDRVIRLILSIIFLAAGMAYFSFLALILGVILLVTGIIGFCPLYQVMGINTNKKGKA